LDRTAARSDTMAYTCAELLLTVELATAVKHQLPIKIVIIKNNTLGQIKWEQMVFLGNPEFGVDLQPIDFVKFAEACGASAFHCEKPTEIEEELSRAVHTPGPAVVEAVVDPFEPPMPAQVTPDQAVKLAKSLARGQPNAGRIALTIFRDKVRDLTGT
jgi:pyruvate dehydrogenase (quinone)/pyruvate oxidase